MPSRSPLVETTRAIAEAVVADALGGPEAVDSELLERTAEALLRKLQNMPRHLSGPMQALTLGFDAAGALVGGRPFRHLPIPRRRAQLRAWERAPVGPLRTFADFYQKMAIFIYLSLQEEQEASS